jgi:hypothetical protein
MDDIIFEINLTPDTFTAAVIFEKKEAEEG